MATASTIFHGTRVNAAENTTNWTNATQEGDVVYQGSYSCSEQVKTSKTGLYYYDSGTTHDMTASPNTTWMCKFQVTNSGSLETHASAVQLRIGSDTADYYEYDLYSNATYPAIGGWQFFPLDPNISGYWSRTNGTPALGAVHFYALYGECQSVAKTDNFMLDAIDLCQGLTVVHGSTAAPATFSSFVEFDEGTATNRYGLVRTNAGIIFNYGTLAIGSANTSTVFDDNAKVITFPNGYYASGWTGFNLNLENAQTSVTMEGVLFLGRGNTTIEDTRPVFIVSGNAGYSMMNNITVDNFSKISLTSSCPANAWTITNCHHLIQGSALVSGVTIDNAPVPSNEAFMVIDDFQKVRDSAFIAGVSGHAIELTKTGTYTVSGLTFTGYQGTPGSNGTPASGDPEAAVYNNSGGSIVFNIAGGGSTPSVRNGTGASTVVNNPITFIVQNMASGGELQIMDSNQSTIIAVEEASTTYSYQYNYVSDKDIIVHWFHLSYLPQWIEGLTLSNENQTVRIQQSVDRVYSNP